MSVQPTPAIDSLIGLMLSVCVCTASETEQHYSPQELKAAKAQLREHSRLWTFEAGAILGLEWTSRAPGSADVRYLHWQILNETDQLPTDERRTAIEASIAAVLDTST